MLAVRVAAPDLDVSTPYRAASIVAIARAAASHHQLRRFYTTLHFGRLADVASRVPLVGEGLRRQLDRRGFYGVPPEVISGAAPLAEIMHLALRRARAAQNPVVVRNLMYLAKRQFDQVVMRRLMRSPPRVFVGMYGASSSSLGVVRNLGSCGILNFVNSHPEEHNRYLRELGGVGGRHHELIPSWVAARVEAELESARVILVPSRFVLRQLEARGVPRDAILLVPYGVELRAYESIPSKHRNGGEVECLYVGQISHRKGISTLIEAARRCRKLPIRFTLVGPLVSPEVLDKLPDNVHYLGSSHPHGVPSAMARADLFVLPTLEDAFGLVVLEAMAAGLPVVTTANAGSSELIADGEDGLVVPPGDPTRLAEAFAQLVEDSSLRRRLGIAGRSKVAASHPWEDYGDEVVRRIVNRCPGT